MRGGGHVDRSCGDDDDDDDDDDGSRKRRRRGKISGLVGREMAIVDGTDTARLAVYYHHQYHYHYYYYYLTWRQQSLAWPGMMCQHEGW